MPRQDHQETSCKQTADIQSRIIAQLEAAPDKAKPLFTPFDDDMIRKYYLTKGGEILAKTLGKTSNQIRGRAFRLGIRRGP